MARVKLGDACPTHLYLIKEVSRVVTNPPTDGFERKEAPGGCVMADWDSNWGIMFASRVCVRPAASNTMLTIAELLLRQITVVPQLCRFLGCIDIGSGADGS